MHHLSLLYYDRPVIICILNLIYLITYALSHLVLTLTKREISELSTATAVSISQLHQLRSRIRARAQKEDHGHGGRTLLENHIEAHVRRRDILFTHDIDNVINDATVNAIYAEAAYQHQFLKGCQSRVIIAREFVRFWHVRVIPLKRVSISRLIITHFKRIFIYCKIFISHTIQIIQI